MNLGKKIRLKKLLLVGASCLIAMPALAQTVQQEDTVIVTARKREESAQKAPLSISAFTSESLKSQKVESLADVSKLTPGLNYTPLFGAQNQLPIIRGSAQTFGALNVGVFLDGAYLSGKAGADIELNDLERVEVVKGPQSALYGRNTFAGAINYVTKPPSSTFGGNVEVTLGDNGLLKGMASISGPLGDVFSFRAGAFVKKSDGFYRSAIDGGNIDFVDTSGGTFVLQARPSDNLKITARITGSQEDNGQPASTIIRTNSDFGTPPGGSASQQRFLLYRGAVPEIGENSVNVNTVKVKGEIGDYGSRADIVRGTFDVKYDFTNMRLSSLTSYSHRTAEYTFDGDNTICNTAYVAAGCPNFGYPFAPAIPLNTSLFATSSADESYIDKAQEFRLESISDSPLQWMIGAYYYENNINAVQRSLSFNTSGATAGTPTAFSFPRTLIDTKSLAEFASLTYKVGDRLTVTGEIRHEKEDQTFNKNPTANSPLVATDGTIVNACKPGATFQASAPPASNSDTSRCVFELEQSFDFVTPRLTIDYQLNDAVMIYATVGKGVKAGGFNDATNITFDQRQYKEEESTNYELGYKSNWIDNRMKFNVAIYHTDWTNQQAACQNPATSGGTSTSRTYVCNVAEATINGAELEWAMRFTNNFSIAANYSYTDAHYDKFLDLSLAGTLAVLGLPAYDFSGRYLPYVPQDKWVVSPRYQTTIGGMRLDTRADFSYQSQSYVRADNMQWFEAKTTVDLRATLSNNNWRIQAFVDNLLDDRTPVAAVRFFDSVNYSVAAPLVTGAPGRQMGVTFGYNF